jgi:hypothetical protein
MILHGFPAKGRWLSGSISGRPTYLFCLVLAVAGCGFAGSSAASCTTGSWSAMQPYMEGFVLDPTAMLQQFPSGGDKLFHGLADFLAADTRLVLPSVIKLIRTANADQKKSIGRALGTILYKCRFADPETSQRIEIKAKKIRDQIVMGAYSSSMHQEDEPQAPALRGLTNDANWPGSGLNITAAPGKPLGANSFKLQLWDPVKQDGGKVSFLPAAH